MYNQSHLTPLATIQPHPFQPLTFGIMSCSAKLVHRTLRLHLWVLEHPLMLQNCHPIHMLIMKTCFLRFPTPLNPQNLPCSAACLRACNAASARARRPASSSSPLKAARPCRSAPGAPANRCPSPSTSAAVLSALLALSIRSPPLRPCSALQEQLSRSPLPLLCFCCVDVSSAGVSGPSAL